MTSKSSTAASTAIKLKRAYEPAEAHDGVRVLVDRLWARGVSKEAAHLDAWMKELGPTAELRKWFGHQSERWDEFAEKYRLELATPLRQLLLAELQGIAGGSTLTLVYGAHDAKENEAVVLREYLLKGKVHVDAKWRAEDTLLVTATVLATARHDAIAPAAALKLFASTILNVKEIDRSLNDLPTSGALRRASGGWRVTANGLRRMRRL
jgi:uncharacterized protein YeaO (DUF488 family)